MAVVRTVDRTTRMPRCPVRSPGHDVNLEVKAVLPQVEAWRVAAFRRSAARSCSKTSPSCGNPSWIVGPAPRLLVAPTLMGLWF